MGASSHAHRVSGMLLRQCTRGHSGSGASALGQVFASKWTRGSSRSAQPLLASPSEEAGARQQGPCLQRNAAGAGIVLTPASQPALEAWHLHSAWLKASGVGPHGSRVAAPNPRSPGNLGSPQSHWPSPTPLVPVRGLHRNSIPLSSPSPAPSGSPATEPAAAAAAAAQVGGGSGVLTPAQAVESAHLDPGASPGGEQHGSVRMLPGLGPTGPGNKPRVVVLGSGWAACRFLKDIDTKAWDVVGVSPRNHMVFTPLLTSTCVGTLEFRSVAEPVEIIQPALSLQPSSHFFLANAQAIDTRNRRVLCEAVADGSLPEASKAAAGAQEAKEGSAGAVRERWQYWVSYDKLVVAVGAQASTFGIRGVHENALFLREVQDAQHIRRRLLLNLMKSDTPGLSDAERRRLLSCVVVGGGPTGVEFSGELGDFIRKDVRSKYAHVKDYVHVTLIEASEILSSFDVSLREYAVRQLTRAGVALVKGQVREVRPHSVLLTDGTKVPYGLLVWSTGVGPSQLVQSLPLPKSKGGRVAVNEWLQVVGHPDVFALGDCSGYADSTGKTVLPALAQVAERQGRYLANRFNGLQRRKGWGKALGVNGPDRDGAVPEAEQPPASGGEGAVDREDKPFVYRHLGSMATIGRYQALVDLRESKAAPGLSIAGFLSFIIWRSAYLTRVISWRNRLYVMVNWATTMLFGRDISRI